MRLLRRRSGNGSYKAEVSLAYYYDFIDMGWYSHDDKYFYDYIS
jgi:hypothetical protein